MRFVALLLAGCVPIYGTGGDGDVTGDGDGDTDMLPDAGPPDTCVPHTCLDIGYSCGPADDGCGGELDCGGCEAPLSCGAEERVCICQFATETVTGASGPLALARDAGGALHLVYAAGGILHHAVRGADGSWTAEPAPEVGAVGARLRAAIDSEGAIHAVFFDGARGLVYARRSPSGTWSTEVIAADAEATADLALDGDGGVHVSFTTFDDLRLASRGPGDPGFAIEVIRDAGPDRDTAIAAADDGTLHIVYVLFFGGDVLHASRAPGAAEWSVETVAEVRGGGFDLAIDAGGGLHLLYRTGAVHYAAAPPGGGSWSDETIGGDANAAALAVTPGGQPHVVWSPDFAGARYLTRAETGVWIEEPLGEHATAADIALGPTGLADIALSVDGPAIRHAAWPCP